MQSRPTKVPWNFTTAFVVMCMASTAVGSVGSFLMQRAKRSQLEIEVKQLQIQMSGFKAFTGTVMMKQYPDLKPQYQKMVDEIEAELAMQLKEIKN